MLFMHGEVSAVLAFLSDSPDDAEVERRIAGEMEGRAHESRLALEIGLALVGEAPPAAEPGVVHA